MKNRKTAQLLGIALTLVILTVPAFIGAFWGMSFFKVYALVILGSALITAMSAVVGAVNNQFK